MRELGIYGPGGFGREVEWLISQSPQADYKVVAYIQDGADGSQSIRDVPVLTPGRFIKQFPRAAVSVSIGDPKTRQSVVSRHESLDYPVLIDSRACVARHCEIGEGTIICAASIVTVDIKIGCQVHVNLDCTIGHDVTIGSFTTLAPGVHVSGNVHIGERVYIGTGATIINGQPEQPLVVEDDCVIGAGACVTKSCEHDCLYAGVPAVLKKRY